MPLPQAILARQQDAIFGVLGESAQWEGVADPVRVRFSEADEGVRADFSDLVGTGRTIKVRKSEVEAPAEGQVVQILDDEGAPADGRLYRIDGEPMLNRRGVWTCPVTIES